LRARGNKGRKWNRKQDDVQTCDDTNNNNECKKDFRWQSWPSKDYTYWDVYSSSLIAKRFPRNLCFRIVYIQLHQIDITSDNFPWPPRLHTNNWRKTDPPPTLLGTFSDPKEQFYVFKTKEKPSSKIDNVKLCTLTCEFVTQHNFRKREINVNKGLPGLEVPKLNLEYSFAHY